MNINRLIYPGFWFGKSSREEALKLARLGVGGFCLYNGTTQEVKDLIEELRANAPHRLLICCDYEYGLGRWHKDAPLLASNISIGASGREDLAYKKGYLTAIQARSLGVDWVFAPVVDLAQEPNNPIVNTRSFGANPQKVASLARSFMIGLEDGGCLNTLKHFPGHGSTTIDSHLAMPVLEKDFKLLEEEDLLPYRQLITKADSIMIGHLNIPYLDDKLPASFSQKVIQNYLREKMHYKGLIITDALVMKAIGPLDPLDAFRAGADILLCPSEPLLLIEKLKNIIHENPLRAQEAISQQEKLISKLSFMHPIPCKKEEAYKSLNTDIAKNCLTQKGSFTLKKGDTVFYLEAETYPSKVWRAKTFIAELKNKGVSVKPYTKNTRNEKVIIATYSNYAAFSGQINFTKEQIKILQEILDKNEQNVLISYGSPFVDKDLEKLNSFILAGSAGAEFEQATAELLLGNLAAKGKIPF
jgi:beta-glucosidase-like glycosyl hydrolase